MTTVAAVIGDPVEHSLSPVILNAAFAAVGLNWIFTAFRVPVGRGADAVDAMRALEIGGLSVTMPLKEEVLAALDDLTPTAARLGAVNCVFRRDGLLVGDSTDGPGLVRALHAEAVEICGRRVVVLGAGGAARSVVSALAEAGAEEVVVLARRTDAATAAASLAGRSGRSGSVDDVVSADMVVNATPLGMAQHGEVMPVDPRLVRTDALAVDIVYHPLRTPWMDALAARGVAIVGGLGMLIGQAAMAFELWTGVVAPVDAMRAAVELELARSARR